MHKRMGGAQRADRSDVDDDVKEGFRRLYDEARVDAERDALELVRCCRMRADVPTVEAAAKKSALSSGRLAAFATNLARATALHVLAALSLT